MNTTALKTQTLYLKQGSVVNFNQLCRHNRKSAAKIVLVRVTDVLLFTLVCFSLSLLYIFLLFPMV